MIKEAAFETIVEELMEKGPTAFYQGLTPLFQLDEKIEEETGRQTVNLQMREIYSHERNSIRSFFSSIVDEMSQDMGVPLEDMELDDDEIDEILEEIIQDEQRFEKISSYFDEEAQGEFEQVERLREEDQVGDLGGD